MTPGPPPTVARAAAALRSGALTSAALTETCLARIAALDGRLHAFHVVTADEARASARLADEERGRGVDRGPLLSRLQGGKMQSSPHTQLGSGAAVRWLNRVD